MILDFPVCIGWKATANITITITTNSQHWNGGLYRAPTHPWQAASSVGIAEKQKQGGIGDIYVINANIWLHWIIYGCTGCFLICMTYHVLQFGPGPASDGKALLVHFLSTAWLLLKTTGLCVSLGMFRVFTLHGFSPCMPVTCDTWKIHLLFVSRTHAL